MIEGDIGTDEYGISNRFNTKFFTPFQHCKELLTVWVAQAVK